MLQGPSPAHHHVGPIAIADPLVEQLQNSKALHARFFDVPEQFDSAFWPHVHSGLLALSNANFWIGLLQLKSVAQYMAADADLAVVAGEAPVVRACALSPESILERDLGRMLVAAYNALLSRYLLLGREHALSFSSRERTESDTLALLERMTQDGITVSEEVVSWRTCSVVLPAYNEERIIARTVQSCVEAMRRFCPNCEIIVVDDGSIDSTGAIADRVSAGDASIRALHNQPDRGYGGALLRGFHASRGHWTFVMDSDGQFDINDIQLLLRVGENDPSAAVLGYRAHRSDSPMRLLNAWGWKQATHALLGLHEIKDIDCAFKLLPTASLRAAGIVARGASVSAEFMTKLQRMGVPIVQLPVGHYPRTTGSPTGAKVSIIIRAFLELFRLHQHLKTWQPLTTGVHVTGTASVGSKRFVLPATLLAAVMQWLVALPMLLLFLRAVMGPAFLSSTRYMGISGDANQYQWYAGWVWYALEHHLPVLVTPAIGYPNGTNLMSLASTPLLGVLFGWLYPFIGVAATSNVIFMANYAMILVFGWLTLRQLGVNRLFAWLGTALFLVIPYLFPQELGHLNLDFIGFHFVVGYLIARLFTVPRRPTLVEGFWMGLSLAAIFYISLELELTVALTLAVLLVYACIFAPSDFFARIRMILNPWYVVGIMLPLLLAVPGLLNYMESVGMQHIVDSSVVYAAVTDVLNLILPTHLNFFHTTATTTITNQFTGNISEWNGYLSVVGIVLIIVAAARTWQHRSTRVLVCAVVTLVVSSLGPSIHIEGRVLIQKAPWLILSRLPFLEYVLPNRLALYFEYLAIVLVTLAANWYAQEPRRLSAQGNALGARIGQRINIGLGVNIASLVLLAACWFPAAPLPSSTFPSAAQILRNPAVSRTYFTNKRVAFLASWLQFPSVMGILADSGNYAFRSPDDYGTVILLQQYPQLLGFRKSAQIDPNIFANYLQGEIPELGMDEVAFVSIHDQPLDSATMQVVSAQLGPPLYDNNGLVVVWAVPPQLAANELTYAFDLLDREVVEYLNQPGNAQSGANLTVSALVQDSIVPQSYLGYLGAATPDPNWTSFGGWVGAWGPNEVGIGMHATPAMVQAIVKKYGHSAAAIIYPYPSQLRVDSQGNPLFPNMRGSRDQTLIVIFNTSGLVTKR